MSVFFSAGLISAPGTPCRLETGKKPEGAKVEVSTMNPRHSGQLFNQTRPIDQKVTPRHSGQLFNTATSDKVRRMRKGQLFHFT